MNKAMTTVEMGSSPRVRGKLTDTSISLDASRLIPACAGKTALLPSWGTDRRAHPRVCGGNGRNNRIIVRDLGSSPRVRGKLLNDSNIPTWVGLIPACAGKTLNDLEF